MRMRFFVVVGVLCAVALVPAAASARTLEVGMSGGDVTTLQNELRTAKYLTASATGYFGPATLAAVKKFQCDKQIVCSGESHGVYGPKTLAALQIAIAPKQPSTLSGGSMTPAATGAFEVSGWIPDWRAASGTQDVLPNLYRMKSVMPFAFEVSANGTLIDHPRIAQEPWPSFITAAKKAGVRVVPTVLWGDGEAMHRVLSDTTKRIALEDAIVALVNKHGFDGIDIDFEAKKAETVNYFATFLKGLYQRMGQKWVYCTAEARMPLEDRYPNGNAPADATWYANDYIAMNKYCDRVEIMAYDQGAVAPALNKARTAPYAPVADPAWVENVMKLAAQTIDRNKLIVGIPTYGYEYKVSMTAGGYKYERLWAFNPKYATDLAAKLGITPTRTSANEVGFRYTSAAVAPQSESNVLVQHDAPTSSVAENAILGLNAAPFNFVTWSDTQAIKDKVDLAHRLGMRGVAIFSLGGAQTPGMWEVLK